MFKRGTAGLLVLIGALAMSAAAQAAPVQVDMSDEFNADVIANGTTLENIDTTQDAVDLSVTSFITQGAAEVLGDCTGDPDGLPNNGRFAKSKDHPLVQLAYDNAKNGRNARRSPDEESYKVAVPHRKYKAIHIFAASGDGDSTMEVKLIFEHSSVTDVFHVEDWFNDPGGDGYPLIDGLDRAQPDASQCFDDSTAVIWGFKDPAGGTRRLKAVKITRTDSGAVLNVFGMTGVPAGS